MIILGRLDEPDGGRNGVVIGHDRRFLAREFAVAAAEVFAGHGVPVWLTQDAAPTPVISYSILARETVGAVNVTASHNPPSDLGFKVRDGTGAALGPEGLKGVEARLPQAAESVERMDIRRAGVAMLSSARRARIEVRVVGGGGKSRPRFGAPRPIQ